MRFALHLADSSGKPKSSSIRAVTRVVNSSSSMDDVHFSPVFLSKGTRYFVGYTVPSSSSVSFYPQASGSGLYNTGYYWKDATATSWAGPYTSRPFAKRIYTSRTQLNPYTTGTNSATFSANSYFLMRSVAPGDMWVDGFEMFTELNAGRSTVSTVLFLGNGSGGRPGSLVRAATMEVDTSATWRRTQFQTPYFVAKGTVFYVGVRTPSSSSTPMRLRSSSGVERDLLLAALERDFVARELHDADGLQGPRPHRRDAPRLLGRRGDRRHAQHASGRGQRLTDLWPRAR